MSDEGDHDGPKGGSPPAADPPAPMPATPSDPHAPSLPTPPSPAPGPAPPPAQPAPAPGPHPHGPAPEVPTTPAVHGKYMLLDVPNFNLADGSGEPMRSYLRLGAVDPAVAGNKARADWGEDLAAKAKKHTRLDGVTEGAADDPKRSKPYEDQVLVFEDDVRKRDPKDGSWSTAQRQAESARIHTKGGWRDHSDGNRITTTRGDKVEVIRGNYKLVVIGRQNKATDDGDDALADICSGFDMSGGEVRGMGMNLGEFETTSVEWVQDDDGRYRFVEKNQKGDTYSIYWGDQHEEFFGEWNVAITGSEDPKTYPPVVPGTTPPSHVNPKIVSKTWAESIEEYTGSAKRRVPIIKSETWAERVETLDDILQGIASNTIVGGGVAEATTIGLGTITTTTIGGGTVENTLIGGGTAENTIVGQGTVSSTIVGGGTTDATIVGLGTAEMTIVGISTSELTVVGVAQNSITVSPLTTELSIGNKMGVSIGNELGVALGNKIDISSGEYTEVYLGEKYTLDIGVLKELFIGKKYSIMLGPYVDLKLDKMNLATKETKLGSTFQKLGFKIDEG